MDEHNVWMDGWKHHPYVCALHPGPEVIFVLGLELAYATCKSIELPDGIHWVSVGLLTLELGLRA